MEGKLADTASNRPLALTIGAAAVTLVLILGVLVGPTVATCFNSADGMGQCLRLRMIDAGLIPATPPAAVADTEAAAEPDAVANLAEPAPEVPVEPASPAVTPTPEAQVSEQEEPVSNEVIAATFGLLRAEPDGSVVIAGSGEPGTDVEIFANGERLGSVPVEPTGDWVFVPDAPLPPGGLEITLGEAGQPGAADQSFIVVIDEDGVTQPLVVASAPGQASEVLQGLTEPQTMAEAEVPALSEPPVIEQPSPAVDAPQTSPSPPSVPAAPTGPEGAATNAPAAPTPQPVPQAEPVETPNHQVAESSPAPDIASAPAPSEIAIEGDDLDAPQTASTGDQPAPASVSNPTVTNPPPTIDAIERDGDRTFFAGAGPEDGTVRLYVDDEFIADAEVEDGRWLVEAGPVLNNDEQRVRADLLQEGSAEVAARAEVDFVVELPEVEQTVTVAEGPAEALPSPAASEAEPVPPADLGVADNSAAPPAPAETQQPAGAVPAPADNVPEAATATESTPQLEVPRMVAVSLGDPEAERFASGRAIIRRGDNLWTIARRVYGEGIRYTTIYDANTAQISDPDRIYPGQVFDLPN